MSLSVSMSLSKTMCRCLGCGCLAINSYIRKQCIQTKDKISSTVQLVLQNQSLMLSVCAAALCLALNSEFNSLQFTAVYWMRNEALRSCTESLFVLLVSKT